MIDLVTRLRKEMGVTHRQGRISLTGKDVQGQYDPSTGVARTAHWGQLDTAAHEFSHDLAFRKIPALDKAIQAHADELIPLDYAFDPSKPPRPEALHEGFAEWSRRYVTAPDIARAKAPAFYGAFEAAMQKHQPKMLRGMQAVQNEYAARLRAPSADRLIASIVPAAQKNTPISRFLARSKHAGTGEAVKALIVHKYADFVGADAGLARAVREMQRTHFENTGKALELEGRENPLILFRTMKVASADGFQNLWEGVRKAEDEHASGPSLRTALEQAYGKDWSPQNRQAFSAYLAGRRLLGEWKRHEDGRLPNQPYHMTAADLRQAMADLDAAHPQFREASEAFNAYTRAELELDYEAGLLSADAYASALHEHEFYAPLNRDVSDKPGGGRAGSATEGAGETAGGLDRFKGNLTRDFLDPVEVTIRRAMTQATVRRFNMAANSLAQVAQKAGRGAGYWAELVPDTEIRPYNVAMEDALKAAAQKYGLSAEDVRDIWQAADIEIKPDDRLTLFESKPTTPRGENMVFFWRDGQRQALRLADGEEGELMLSYMVGLTKDVQNAIVSTMRPITHTLQVGATAMPQFAVANAIRDAFDVWFKVPGALPGLTTLSGLKEIATNSPIAKSYERFGRIKGGVATAMLDEARFTAKPTALKKEGAVSRHFVDLRAFARFAELSELATRVGVYKIARKKALKRGLSEVDAAFDAANESAETMPFDRVGRKTRSIRALVPFLNAYTQGIDRAARLAVPGTALFKLKNGEALTRADKEAIHRGGRYWAMVGTIPVMISLAIESYYADDPDFQEVSPYFRATHWVIKADDLGIPKHLQKYTDKFVRIPKPFEHAALGNVAERQYERIVLDDAKANDKMLSGLWELVGPPSTLSVWSPAMQAAANRSFTGAPIVPEHLMGAGDPELKVSPNTSEFSKLFAHEIGDLTEAVTGKRQTFSPAMADHWITSLTATAGRDFLSESSRVVAAAKGKEQPALGPDESFFTSRFVFDNSRSSQSQKDFWSKVGRDRGEYEGGYQDISRTYKENPADALQRLSKMPDDKRDFALAKMFASTLEPKFTGAAMLHPMARAQAVVGALADIRQAIKDGVVANTEGPIELSAEQRRLADDILSHMSMAEERNALIAAGAKGYTNKQPMDIEADRKKLDAISPELIYRLDDDLASENVPSAETVQERWPELRQELRDMAAVELEDLMGRKVRKTRKGRYQQLIRENEAVLGK